MLANTFIHVPGIGSVTEQKLWDSGIDSWGDIGALAEGSLSPSKMKDIHHWIDQSNIHLENNNPKFFESHLPAHQHFRYFPEFKNSCAYLDIETTGLSESATITTIALYDGNRIKYYIQGENLNDFVTDIQDYTVLITYNGRSFDIPFIEAYFNIQLSQAQIDLRYVLGHLGYKGGLKKCEKALGIDRDELDGVDGYFAVILWRFYQQTGNEKALETLLAYNIEDVINLETLMINAYNLSIEKTRFSESHCLDIPVKPDNPFRADQAIIDKLKRIFY